MENSFVRLNIIDDLSIKFSHFFFLFVRARVNFLNFLRNDRSFEPRFRFCVWNLGDRYHREKKGFFAHPIHPRKRSVFTWDTG